MARRVNSQTLCEERSLAMHRAIADRLPSQPDLADRARVRVRGWLESGSVHPTYARQWMDILERPLVEIAESLVALTERAIALRSVSPFAGALGSRERWAIHRSVKERIERSDPEP